MTDGLQDFRYNCYEKKIINYLRLIVLLMATTTIYMYIYPKDIPKQQVQSINVEGIYTKLDEIEIKIDRILEETKVRDTVLLSQIFKIQQQLGPQGEGMIAKVKHQSPP